MKFQELFSMNFRNIFSLEILINFSRRVFNWKNIWMVTMYYNVSVIMEKSGNEDLPGIAKFVATIALGRGQNVHRSFVGSAIILLRLSLMIATR